MKIKKITDVMVQEMINDEKFLLIKIEKKSSDSGYVYDKIYFDKNEYKFVVFHQYNNGKEILDYDCSKKSEIKIFVKTINKIISTDNWLCKKQMYLYDKDTTIFVYTD